MSRKDLYAKIAELKLSDYIKAKFGKHYTNVSNADLEKCIEESTKKVTESTCIKENVNTCNCTPSLKKLIEVLGKKRILLKSEIDYIYNN